MVIYYKGIFLMILIKINISFSLFLVIIFYSHVSYLLHPHVICNTCPLSYQFVHLRNFKALYLSLGSQSNDTQCVTSWENLQVWEFDLDHQRWLPVAELALSDDKGDPVYTVSWAPNVGRQDHLLQFTSIILWSNSYLEQLQ